MRTIPAREIKRRGITAVDDALKDGPVHIIKNDAPTYVVMREEHYEELVDAYRDQYLAGVRESLQDAAAGRTRTTTVEQLITELGLEI